MSRRSIPPAADAQAGVDFLTLPQWQTVAIKETAHSYEVEALPLSEPSACPRCGGAATALRPCGAMRQAAKDAPVRGKHVVIHFSKRLYRCGGCGRVSRQPLPGINVMRRATDRLIEMIGSEAFRKTYSLVSKETGVSADMVRKVFVERVLRLERSVKPKAPRLLGLDEAYVRGRARYILSDLDARQALEILPKTDMLTLCRYLLQMRHEPVEVVVIDFCRSQQKVVKRVLPQATVVVNKWSVWCMAQQTLAACVKRMRADLPAGQRIRLLRAAKYINKSHSRLFPDEQQALAELFRQLPELGDVYYLRRGFFGIWSFRDRWRAEGRYEEWSASIPPALYYAFGDLLRTIEGWRQEVFNYFDYPVTNAFTESVNRKLNVLQTISPTYSFEAIRARVLYERFAERPQPPSTGAAKPSLKPKTLRVRPRARRAPGPDSFINRIEKMERTGGPNDEFNLEDED